jgi:BASS family bile acid:Na+ symporter
MLLAVAMDQVKLRFDPSGLMLLNIILGLIMFGIALDLKVSDFKRVFKAPKSIIVGLTAQLLLLPALTFLLTMVLQPAPSIALGMMMVAACPGGNISNFITHLSKGNTSLSISMTAVVSVGALFATPLNISLWGSLNPATAKILRQVNLDPVQLLLIVFILLGLPLVLGMVVAAKFPAFAEKARKPFKIASIVVFTAFIVIALQKNFDHFIKYIAVIAGIVLLHNALAFTLGYGTAWLARLEESDRRAVTIEVGIQNSGLGLILIFNFFDGLGGMAMIAAWWGVWHICAGLTLSSFWSRREPVRAADGSSESPS